MYICICLYEHLYEHIFGNTLYSGVAMAMFRSNACHAGYVRVHLHPFVTMFETDCGSRTFLGISLHIYIYIYIHIHTYIYTLYILMTLYIVVP